MKKIIGLIALTAVLCCSSASACDVKIVNSQHNQISGVDTTNKIVRSSNGSIIVTRIDMPWGFFVKTGIAEDIAKDFDVITNESEGKSFIDPANNMKHIFMKNVDGATIYIIGNDRSITSFISDMENCGKNRFEEVFIK